MANQRKCTSQQLKLFQSQMQSILFHVTKQNLTFQQLYLIYFESNIKFLTQNEQFKLKQIFIQSGNMLPLRQCISLIQLHSCQILHNRPVFYILVKQINKHNPKECLNFFKQIMELKYGLKINWFGRLAEEQLVKKMSCFKFKNRLKQILKETPHKDCFDIISHKFPKTVKNQIEKATFMAVVRYIDQKHDRISIFQRSKQKQHNKQYVDPISIQNSQQKIMQNFINKPCIYASIGRKFRRSDKTKKTRNINKQICHQYQKFMTKSSLQISKQYQQAMQKFKMSDFNSTKKSSRYRATSAKSSKKLQTNDTTQTNWRNKSINSGKNNKVVINNYFSRLQQRGKIRSVAERSNRFRHKCQTEPTHYDDQL